MSMPEKLDPEIVAIYPGKMGDIPITQEMWDDVQPFREASTYLAHTGDRK